jgi:hypothetical protein
MIDFQGAKITSDTGFYCARVEAGCREIQKGYAFSDKRVAWGISKKSQQ